MAIADEAGFELELRMLAEGGSRRFTCSVRAVLLVIHEQSEINGIRLKYLFVFGPLELVERLKGVEVTETEIAVDVAIFEKSNNSSQRADS